jgi:hypothetical protein
MLLKMPVGNVVVVNSPNAFFFQNPALLDSSQNNNLVLVFARVWSGALRLATPFRIKKKDRQWVGRVSEFFFRGEFSGNGRHWKL